MARSKKRSWGRRVRHRLVYWAARAASGLMGALPFDAAVALGRALGRAGYLLVWTERRRAMDHLRLAYGDSLSEKERRRIVREMFANFGNIAAEVTHIPKLTPEEMRRRVRVVQKDKFRAILAEAAHRGLIVITAHLGAWEWVAHYAPLVEGIRLVVVAREQSNPLIQAWSERVRQTHGVEVVYRKRAGLPTVRALKRGGAVGILLDQCTKGEGVFTPFFGWPTHTLTAPARLALRTGALVVPAFFIREDGGRRLALHLGEPVPLPEEKNADLAAYQLTASLASIIEEQIRRWPEQWVWIHRRWRRTPETDRDPVYDPASRTVIPSPKGPRRRSETAAV